MVLVVHLEHSAVSKNVVIANNNVCDDDSNDIVTSPLSHFAMEHDEESMIEMSNNFDVKINLINGIS